MQRPLVARIKTFGIEVGLFTLPAFLVPKREGAAVSRFRLAAINKQGGTLHLVKHTQAFPGLPLVDQLIADRHDGRIVLAVEGVFALHHPYMASLSQVFCSLDQGLHDLEACDRRELDRGILPAGSFHAYRCGGNNHIASHYRKSDPAAGSHADEGVAAAFEQLFHCDGSRRPPDSGGGYRNFLPIQESGVGHVLAVVSHQHSLIEVFGDERPLGIAEGLHSGLHRLP